MRIPGKGIQLDIIKGSIATLTLFLAYVTFPMVGLLPGIFVPLPAVYYTLKGGKFAGAAVVAIVAGVLAIVAGVSTVALYLLQCGIISLTLPFLISRGKGAARAIVVTVLLNITVLLLLASVYGFSQGVNLDRQVKQGIETSISQTALLYEKKGISGDDLKALQDGMRQAGALIGVIYPALIVVGVGIVAGVNLLALKRLSARLPVPVEIDDFKKFKNPEQLVWVVIVAGFAMLANFPDVTRVALNVLIVALFMYSIQRLAIIAHFFVRFAVPTFVRTIIYLLLFLQPYLAIAVAALGIFDIWGNFRAPKHHENL